MTSRRDFLGQVASVTALSVWGRLPIRERWATRPIDLLPDPDEDQCRALALVAIEAARSAGAAFADVRVTTGRRIYTVSNYQRSGAAPFMGPPTVELMVGYGVRALVNGAWGFASGYELTPDAVARAARAAAGLARANRPRHRTTLDLAPTAKVANGRWATAIEQDPFRVSFGDQADVQLAALAEASKVPEVYAGNVGFDWRRLDHVFASTDGSVIVQRIDRAGPSAWAVARMGEQEYTVAPMNVRTLRGGGYGYEAVARVDLVGGMREAAEGAVAKAKTLTPPIEAETGRYDAVFSPKLVAMLFAQTIGVGTNLERALGYDANHGGTSFAAPPDTILGQYRAAAPLFTVRAERSRPHGYATVGWDDEGVKPEAYTLIQDGVIVDYQTNRQTAPELGAWYAERGEGVRSHGTTVGGGQNFPKVSLPNLVIEPGKTDLTTDDLIAGVKRGVYIDMYSSGQPDHQLLSAQYNTRYSQVHEIRNGKLGARIAHLDFQFLTPQFWRGVDAIGGRSSVVEAGVDNGIEGIYLTERALHLSTCSISAVPMRARQINIVAMPPQPW